MEFSEVTLENLERIFAYTSAYGEGSCQHSPISMYSLKEKYDDRVCEKDGFLYILRSGLCDDTYRVYLAPLGEGDLRGAFENILSDAASHGKKVKFLTLTEKTKTALEEAFPGRFTYEGDRDLSEYVYRTEVMSTYAGKKLRKRRQEVAKFWAAYGDRATVKKIEASDFPDILAFEKRWVEINSETNDRSSLELEAREIERQLAIFDELHLSGIVLRIDGEVHGFGYGTKLSDEMYDAIIEKGDRDVPDIYKILRQESVKQCAVVCPYVNLEEDVGLPGLRAVKLAYQPEYLIDKYIVTEV